MLDLIISLFLQFTQRMAKNLTLRQLQQINDLLITYQYIQHKNDYNICFNVTNTTIYWPNNFKTIKTILKSLQLVNKNCQEQHPTTNQRYLQLLIFWLKELIRVSYFSYYHRRLVLLFINPTDTPAFWSLLNLTLTVRK